MIGATVWFLALGVMFFDIDGYLKRYVGGLVRFDGLDVCISRW